MAPITQATSEGSGEPAHPAVSPEPSTSEGSGEPAHRQSRQSLRWSQTERAEVDEGSDQNSDI